MIKIGVPYWYGERPLDKFAEEIAKQNIDFIEISLDYPYPEQLDINEINKIKGKYGIEISFHGLWSDVSISHPIKTIANASMRVIGDQISFAKQVNPIYFIVHQAIRLPTAMFENVQKKINENSIKTTKEIVTMGKDVNLIIENVSSVHFGNFHDLISMTNDNDVKVCLDVGHVAKYCSRAGLDFKEQFDISIDKLKDKIVVVHLHDFISPEKDHVPIGSGELNIEYILKRIKETSCKYILLEYHHNFDFNTYGRDVAKIRKILNS
ncbi:MAG: sugar phosphate isomerase/epimerase [Nanoarchaeota archaeon]|nr:sugar phosphate isomerase/epimerase [Nanoarchaeota archaeon]